MTATFTVRGASSGWVVDLGNGIVSMETVLCTHCGLLYALPEAMIGAARSKGQGEITWRCPNRGCSAEKWGYHGRSEEEKLRDRLESERARAARLAAERDQLAAAERGQRAAKTRFRNERDAVRKRVAAGVCPCCGRTFKQLARHMASQHPDFPPPPEADDA